VMDIGDELMMEGDKICKVGSWMLSFSRCVSSWGHVDNDW
jgi:hypothetical protein